MMLIHYIHHNPIHHNFVEHYGEWKYSSFAAIVSDYSTKINRNEVLNIFGGEEVLVDYHNSMKNYNTINHLVLE
ncbi:MAG TPA: hypothetical protein VE868_07815 [Balneolaceae bacterium]|nr:hypothetical protein [Balneolaceae bacterium]